MLKWTQGTKDLSFLGVAVSVNRLHVSVKVWAVVKAVAAEITCKRPLAGVYAHVGQQVLSTAEPFWTNSTHLKQPKVLAKTLM